MNATLDEPTGCQKAQDYEAEIEARPDELALEQACRETLHAILDDRPKAAVLDLCCGTGRSLSWILDHANARNVVGIDLSPAYLAFAKNRFADDARLDLIQGDVLSTPLSITRWDVILLARAYHHIEDERKPAFLRRVTDLLAPSGKVVIGDCLLPPHDEGDPTSRKKALKDYFGQVLRSMDQSDSPVPARFREAILSKALTGQDDEGEHKTSSRTLLCHLQGAALCILHHSKVGAPVTQTLLSSPGYHLFTVCHQDAQRCLEHTRRS